MFSKRFEKKAFKAAVKDNVKTLYRKTIDEATPQQLFQAVSYAVKDVIIDDWIETQKRYDETDAKTVYYMSMEFLMGRALGNNLINMTAYKDVKEALGLEGLEALHGRAEDLARDKSLRAAFDLCVSRAVANLSVLSEYCVPFVRTNGYFVSYKGKKGLDETLQVVIGMLLVPVHRYAMGCG